MIVYKYPKYNLFKVEIRYIDNDEIAYSASEKSIFLAFYHGFEMIDKIWR